MTMQMQGLQRLQKKLKQFPKEVVEEVRAAMEASAKEIVEMAQRLVPVDSMQLHDSIGWTWGDAPSGSISLGEVRAGPGTGNMRITIYAGSSEAFWARWVEFGTKPHDNNGTFPGTKHPGTQAQPFFYPSYRANRRRAKSRTSRAVNKAAKKIASMQVSDTGQGNAG